MWAEMINKAILREEKKLRQKKKKNDKYVKKGVGTVPPSLLWGH